MLVLERNRLSGSNGTAAMSTLEPKLMLASSTQDLNKYETRNVGDFTVQANVWGVEEFIKEKKKGFPNNNATRDRFTAEVQTSSTNSDGIKGAKFTIKNDGLKTTDARPLAYPSVFIGESFGRKDTNAYDFKGLKQSEIGSAKFRLGSNATSKSGEFNVSMDVWLGGSDTEPNEYLMVMPYNSRALKKNNNGTGQPAGSIVEKDVKIDGTTYDIWRGKNHQNKNVTSYVATKGSNKITGDLNSFIKDANERKCVSGSNDLKAVYGGAEVWSGANGLNVDFGIDIKKKTTPKKKAATKNKSTSEKTSTPKKKATAKKNTATKKR